LGLLGVRAKSKLSEQRDHKQSFHRVTSRVELNVLI